MLQWLLLIYVSGFFGSAGGWWFDDYYRHKNGNVGAPYPNDYFGALLSWIFWPGVLVVKIIVNWITD